MRPWPAGGRARAGPLRACSRSTRWSWSVVRSSTRGPSGADAGSGTVLAVGVVAGLTTLLVSALVLAGVLAAGQQARSAADLAALAGAGQVVTGHGQPAVCGVAGEVARANGGQLQGCALVRADGDPWPRVQVTVTTAVAGTPWTATARAVAGGVARDP